MHDDERGRVITRKGSCRKLNPMGERARLARAGSNSKENKGGDGMACAIYPFYNTVIPGRIISRSGLPRARARARALPGSRPRNG